MRIGLDHGGVDPKSAVENAEFRQMVEAAVRKFNVLPEQMKRMHMLAQRISFAYGQLPEGNTRTKEQVAQTVLAMTCDERLLEDPEFRNILLGE